MKKLTLKDKQKIVEMLGRHYTIDATSMILIDMAADNAEQMTELTLKAYSIAGKPQNNAGYCISADPSSGKPTVNDTSFAIVQIDDLSSPLQLIKAIKEIAKWSLREAKDFVDVVVSFERMSETGTRVYKFKPFGIGPSERITVAQWTAICTYLYNNFEKDAIKYHFV